MIVHFKEEQVTKGDRDGKVGVSLFSKPKVTPYFKYEVSFR